MRIRPWRCAAHQHTAGSETDHLIRVHRDQVIAPSLSADCAVVAAFTLDAWLDVPIDPGAAAGPRSLLAADRSAAWIRGSARGLPSSDGFAGRPQ